MRAGIDAIKTATWVLAALTASSPRASSPNHIKQDLGDETLAVLARAIRPTRLMLAQLEASERRSWS